MVVLPLRVSCGGVWHQNGMDDLKHWWRLISWAGGKIAAGD
jgi:hypothetical protein